MNRCKLFSISGIALLAILAIPQATSQAVTLQEVARFDVAASADGGGTSYIGNNPSAVAWNGRQLFIAGFNSSGGSADTAIIEITNALSTGVNVAAFGTPFGALATPNLRGYSGLDIEGTVLAAAYDDGGSDPNGIQAFDASAGTQNWARSARGGSGVAFDPGFGGADAGSGLDHLRQRTQGTAKHRQWCRHLHHGRRNDHQRHDRQRRIVLARHDVRPGDGRHLHTPLEQRH